ncbi:MAG: inositol monophosphatase family protein [Gemmatimonadales bacterium]|jgi:myo-inositol-1(or 4)-monophosphatase
MTPSTEKPRDATPGSPVTAPSQLLATARRAAEAAAAVHRRAAGQLDPSQWGEKGRSDFVTEVDIESERRILEIVREEWPDHEVMAEESAGAGAGSEGPRGSGVRWIIDPLDGTTNWLHGYPEYAVSIAAQDRNGLAAAVVLNSAVGECFEAARGEGARRDGAPIRVSGLEELRLALVGTGFPFKRLHVLPLYVETFTAVMKTTAGIRRAGAAALDLCDVACGRLDAFFEFHLMPWDVAAGGLIVREAGGRFEPLPVPGIESEGTGELPVGGYVAGCPGVWEAFRDLMPD